MNGKKKKPVAPKLRFPEFRDTGEWEVKRLGEVCEINPSTGTLPDKFIYIDLESVVDGRLIKKQEISKKEAPIRAQRVLEYGDVIYQTVRPYQKNNYLFELNDGKKYVASTGYAQLRACNSENFLFQLLHIEPFTQKVLSKCTGSNYPAINSSDLSAINIFVPKPAEQQKIADCLSSLDELIELEAQQYEALRQYKKGLMQQLFPQEGETTPRLRFPEFRNAGEWEMKYGNSLFIPVSNKEHDGSLPVLAITQENGAIPRHLIDYHVSVTEKSLKSYKVVEIGDFIISLRTFQGGIEYSDYKGICSPAYIVLRKATGEVVNDFFRYYFKTKKYIADLNRNLEGLRDGKMVSYKQFSEIKLPLPSPHEQQKIADCLSSLDELIELQSQKVEALKQHKKGLMQQLFPQEVA